MARTPGSPTKRKRVKNARQRIWNAMRVHKNFTIHHLEAAETGPDNLKKYVKALSMAGYLRQVRAKQNGKDGGGVVWRLVEKTGPFAPIVRRDKSGIYDPNLDVLVPFKDVKEANHERVPVSSSDQPDDSACCSACCEEFVDDHIRRQLA